MIESLHCHIDWHAQIERLLETVLYFIQSLKIRRVKNALELKAIDRQFLFVAILTFISPSKVYNTERLIGFRDLTC